MKKFFNSLLNPALKPAQVNFGLLVLRLTGGLMMLSHGFPKFRKLISGDLSFADPIGLGEEISLILAVFSEFICAILISIGLWTRISAFFLGFTMFIAAFIQHGDDPFSRKEKALLYFMIYLVIWIVGPGRLSIDQKVFVSK